MILFYQDIFQLHASLWIGALGDKLEKGKSGKPQSFLVGCQEWPGSARRGGGTPLEWLRKEGREGRREWLEGTVEGERWEKKEQTKEGDWKWVRGECREEKRGEGTWGLDQGPNHSTAEYVWKWSHQSWMGMGGERTHTFTYIHKCKRMHPTYKRHLYQMWTTCIHRLHPYKTHTACLNTHIKHTLTLETEYTREMWNVWDSNRRTDRVTSFHWWGFCPCHFLLSSAAVWPQSAAIKSHQISFHAPLPTSTLPGTVWNS